MPKNFNQKPKKGGDGSSTSFTKVDGVPVDTVKFGKKMALKTLQFTNVKDGVALSSTNSAGMVPTVFPSTAFIGSAPGDSDFDITKYVGVGSVDICAAYLSNSQELKKEVIKSGMVEVKIATNYSLFVCNELQATSVVNAVSFNRACAIMSFQILRHTIQEVYDWEKNSVVAIKINEPKSPNQSYINQVAGQMRLQPDNPYYWMVVPGYEFLYDVFPIETIALTIVRLECRKVLNIPDSMTNSDIVSSLVAKINRRNNLTKHTITDVIKQLGVEQIKSMYDSFKMNVGTTGREVRNEDAITHFMEFINSHGTTV
uniref:Putative nucleocapsid protein n=1 Tax=Emaravirus cercidis TaxID=1980432 RepID=G3G897_9VIRU|nr:putative nucleocapsid protein [Emaravirus cercidis]